MTLDLCLYNGRFHTMDPSLPEATALSIQRGRIVAAGGDDAVRALGDYARAVDLGGRCAIPGMVDAHLHFESYSLGLTRIDAETDTVGELQDRVAARAAELPPGAWILGHGWNHNRWGGEFPTRQLLDVAAPDHPVYLTAKSGHAAWVNGGALKLAGITAATEDPAGGALVRDGAGEPAGVLLEEAAALVSGLLPEPGLGDSVAAMRRGTAEAHRRGLTGVHDLDGARALRAWQVLREGGELGLRVVKSIPGSLADRARELGLRTGLGDDWLRLGGVKLFADGALGPRTAWMEAPYEGDPDNCGMPLADPRELEEAVMGAARAGLACYVHAIGDRANREVLGMLAAARQVETGSRPLRHRVEHVQVLRPEDLPRLSELGVIASMQPIHATSDMEMADRHWGGRVRGAYAFRSLLGHGTALAFGSDAPVEPIDPLAGVHAAVTRRRGDGTPGEEGWQPQERLSVVEAVRAYTAGAAFAAGAEGRVGTLSPGKLADITVLDRDIFSVPPMEIINTRAVAAIVGGRCLYAAPDSPIEVT